MWTILESRKAEKTLDKLPKHLLQIYQVWKNIVIQSGPAALVNVKKFKDHALSGEWKGYRSSSLDYATRVIYSFSGSVLTVEVAQVTQQHDYKKKG